MMPFFLVSGVSIFIILGVAVYLFVFRWSVNVPDYMAARHYRFGQSTSDKPISGKRCIVIPYIDQLVMIDQRIQQSTLDNIKVLTKERQNMLISAMIVWKSENAAMTIENIKPEDIQPTFFKIMESVIKNECAKMDVDEILENRSKLSANLSATLKETADNWGLKIASVNISNLEVSNEKFMRNMALPREVEIERKAALAEIEKNLTIELKTIEKDTQSQLASLKLELTIGEEKEVVASALETAERVRITALLAKDKEIERLHTEIKEIKESSSTKTDAERTKSILLAEAEGLEKRSKVLAAYDANALQYELINHLPEIYNNLKIGDLTLFQNGSGQTSELDKIGVLCSSLITGLGVKALKNANTTEQEIVEEVVRNESS